MAEFELGVMAGWVAGVVTAGAIAGALDWWSERNRVVTIHTTTKPCNQGQPDEGFGVDDVVVTRGPVVLCPTCKGFKEVPFNPVGRVNYRGPRRIPCGCCKGAGVVAVDKIAEPCGPIGQEEGGAPVVAGLATDGKVACCLCKGRGWHQNFDRRKFKGELPPPVQCGMCKGTGWMTPPPKKP